MTTQKRSDKKHRVQISEERVGKAADLVRVWLFRRLNNKGFGAWLSRHEIIGSLTEEYHEAVEATHSRSSEELRAELVDIAVSCIFGIACIDEKTLDW